MSGIRLTDLHDEILEKIFLHTSNDNIKTLTEVCRRFNDVIGSNAKLMDKFIIVWKEVKFKDVIPLIASKRKYRNIEIVEIGLDDDLVCFLNSHNSTLTKLSLNWTSLSIFDCEVILKFVRSHIVDLKLYDVKIWGEMKTAPIDFPNIQTLYFSDVKTDKMSLIFNFFMGAKIDILIYREYRSLNEVEITSFSHMMASFPKLAIMDISVLELQLFENDYLAKNAKFELKKCVLMAFNIIYGRPEDFINWRYVNLLNFLSGHRNTLIELDLTNFPMTSGVIECICNLEKLHDLLLCSFSTQTIQKPFRVSTSIHNLTIILDENRETDICHIISSFVNIYNLTVKYSSFTFDFALSVVNNFKNLQKISFHNLVYIFPMAIPTVTSMEFINVASIDTIIQVLQVNQQLKFIKIPRILENHPKYLIAMDGLNLETLEFY